MNRQKQLWSLIILTAITMVPQYALQGWLATGGTIEDIAEWVYLVDAGAWSLRAIIEPLVLAFLFSIQASNASNQERKILLAFEVALIALITITLGPTLASIGLKKSIVESLQGPFYWLWNFGIASYAPLMLGAMGFAFKLEARVGNTAKAQPARPASPRRKAEPERKAKRKTETKDKDKITLQAVASQNGAAITRSEIAKQLGEAPSTTGRRIARLIKQGQLQDNDGKLEVANGS